MESLSVRAREMVLAVEGLLYFAFPEKMKPLMNMMHHKKVHPLLR